MKISALGGSKILKENHELAAHLCVTLNEQLYLPTMCYLVDADDNMTIVAKHAMPIGLGMTDAQLEDCTGATFAHECNAIEQCEETFPHAATGNDGSGGIIVAWFKKADWPQPVTIDRVEQLFKHNNRSYTRREDGITAMVDGFFLSVTIADGKALDLGFRFREVPLTQEALPKVQGWAQERNLDGEVYVSSQHAFVVTQGATDEQLAEFFRVGIQTQLDNLKDFVEEWGMSACSSTEDNRHCGQPRRGNRRHARQGLCCLVRQR